MSGSSFGTLLRLSTFGESHGVGIGGTIDGFPSNFEIDFEKLNRFVAKRKPGQSKITTQRKEDDEIEFLSGIFEGKTTGTPIAFLIRNNDAKSKDYDNNKDVYRPSHADFTYDQKYGIRDYRGGGRSSARETVARVVAGGLAIQYLNSKGIQLQGFVDQVGDIRLPWKNQHSSELEYTDNQIETSIVRCPDSMTAMHMQSLIEETKASGDSIGGCVACKIVNLPIGLGEPVFDKIHAVLGQALFSINAVKGVEFGAGFESVTKNGSEHNDLFLEGGKTSTNYSAGSQGGITNGMPIYFRVAFKPVATIAKIQNTIDADLKTREIQGKGRHDACVVPRAVPIVEAMTAMVILDFYLLQKAYA
jgi:chorismate synthase|tara:strand:- start:16426 stop:17508 length:1083 start_codon:yes stop_codon:yes gene_type:complete